MRNKMIIFLLVLIGSSSLSHAMSASQFNMISFTYGYIYGSVEFPEEAHPADIITYNLSIAAYIDVTINNFTLAISGLMGENWQTFATEQIISYSLGQGGLVSRQVVVVLPQNASQRLNCIIEASTDKGFGRTSFYATYVRAITYDELTDMQNALLTNYSNLLNDYDRLSGDFEIMNSLYTSLEGQYSSIQGLYESLNSSYDSLYASYASLRSGLDSLNESYMYVKAKYDSSAGELSIVRNLMYAFGISAVILAALAVYYRKKAPYIVLQKETARSA